MEGPYIVTVDRSNWKYGSTNINFLVIGIVYKNLTIPIVWHPLDKAGSSNTQERKELMNEFLKAIPVENIEVFLADREFVGKEWLQYLHDKSIPYAIRIKGNFVITLADGKEITAEDYFGKTGKYRTKRLEDITVCGVKTNLAAAKKGDESQIIAYSNTVKRSPVKLYQKRWTIESSFKALKSQGFNLEETKMTCLEKLKKLFAVVVIAMTFAIKMGKTLNDKIPIKIKNNKRLEFSFFSYGKNYIISRIKSDVCEAINVRKLKGRRKIVVY